MRILYDGEIYGLQQVGGISRYFDNIISRLPDEFQPGLTTSVRSREYAHPHHPNLSLYRYKRGGYLPRRLGFWTQTVSDFIEPYYFRTVEVVKNFQVFHPTYYTMLSQQDIGKRSYPVVLTVYDMIHEVFADSIDTKGEFAEIKRRAIMAAEVILCISENTKKDLMERYKLKEERVWVTHLATEISPDGDEPKPVPSRPYYLHVGGRWTYKNFDNLLLAFSRVILKFPEIILCVVGAPFDDIEQRRIRDLKLERSVRNVGYESDSYLAKLYQNCIALVYPSLYEGFGLPLLEAMKCKAPIIASNTSSIPEVVGEAALLFDPRSISDLADKLSFLIENPEKREYLIAKGLVQVQKFSWDSTAAKTVQAYRYAAA